MILNRQRRMRVPVRALEEFLTQACKALRVSAEAVTVCLVTNSEMARWNLLYRRKDRPTDVLSFPAVPMEGGGKQRQPLRRKVQQPGGGNRESDAKHVRRAQHAVPPRWRPQNRSVGDPFPVTLKNYLGDIAIAPEVARRNARKYGRSLSDEMRILILHGILHLMGYDHETDTGQMERREQRLRQALGLG
jgi:ssRNA-specific RNase YbeY (16S rRNA maturation enzyme)